MLNRTRCSDTVRRRKEEEGERRRKIKRTRSGFSRRWDIISVRLTVRNWRNRTVSYQEPTFCIHFIARLLRRLRTYTWRSIIIRNIQVSRSKKMSIRILVSKIYIVHQKLEPSDSFRTYKHFFAFFFIIFFPFEKNQGTHPNHHSYPSCLPKFHFHNHFSSLSFRSEKKYTER